MIEATSYDRDTDEYILLAVFRLVKNVIRVVWEPNAQFFQSSIMNNGIITANGKFTLNDGKEFMNNLPIAYANSSTVMIREIKDGTKPSKKRKNVNKNVAIKE
jgi:hypothetical protein